MKIGTKSVLFGVHQFILHPFFVLVSWLILYRKLPSFKELCAIATHDLGYFGSPNMDGDEGEQHPEIIASIWRKYFGGFGKDVSDIVIGHSRFHAKKNNIELSSLFAPDKLATAIYPKLLYLILGNLSGEIEEYMSRCVDDKYEGLVKDRKSQLLWLIEVQGHMMLMGVQGGDYHHVKNQMDSRESDSD